MSVLKGYKGKWKVDITDGIDPLTGEIKRHRKSGFTTRKEAVQYEADYRLNKLHQVQIKDKISVSHLYSLGGDRPSQTAHHALSPARMTGLG